jgi:predicted PurR-regulated permease PerM
MQSRVSSYFFFIVLLLAVVAAVFILFPFLAPVLLAIAAAVVVYPIHRDLQKFIGSKGVGSSISALLTVIIVLVVVIVPLFFLAQRIYGEVQSLYGMLIDEGNRSEVINGLSTVWNDLSRFALGLLPAHSFESFDITEILKSGLQWVFANLDVIFSSLTLIAGYALIFLIALFYFLRDGASLKKMVMSWSPMLLNNEGYITQTFKRAIKSVFGGTLAVCLIDGVAIGLAFWAFGIPGPALWGTLAGIAALIPGFGVSLIIWPAAAYLVLSHNYLYAAGMLIWGYAAIILVDHMIGPLLINRGIKIHPFLILLSVLGGILTFGIIGFVMGPLVLVVLFTLLEIYKTSFISKDTSVS